MLTMAMLLKGLLVLVLVCGVLIAAVYFGQHRLVYFPETGREIASTPASQGLAYEDVAILTDDGETLGAWWLPAPEARGAVLLLHGNAGNISHRIEYARMFRALGYGTLLVDYRGYGTSTGTPSEQGTYRDAAASWRWLSEMRGVAPRDIVVFGESLGGGVASWLAQAHAPRALVLASTFTSVPDLAAEIYPVLPVRWLSRVRYDTLERLPRVNAPVLILHSTGDDIIPFSHGRKLYEAAREPKQFLELRGGHNDGFVHAQPDAVAALGAFLDRAQALSDSAQAR